MTDPAPPARTPLTPEEWGMALLNSIRAQRTDADALHLLSVALRTAETAARAEGRLAGLLEAVDLCGADAQANDREAAQATSSAMVAKWHNRCLAMEHCAERIRRLAADVRKAPTSQTPSDPDPR